MLSPVLDNFNQVISKFQAKYPQSSWSEAFKDNLINEFTYYSNKIENESLQYGETIRFLKNELVESSRLYNLLEVSTHKDVLKKFIETYESFEITEDSIKSIHKDLMGSELAWEGDYNPSLIGNYRNFPVIGYRQPLFENKEYVPFYNLDFVMSSYTEIFRNKFSAIDNTRNQTHIISNLAYFHNIFLNKIHPFADGNGRVCRIIIGILQMKNGIPPIFPSISTQADIVEYITKIIECEKTESDLPFIEYLATNIVRTIESKVDKN